MALPSRIDAGIRLFFQRLTEYDPNDKPCVLARLADSRGTRPLANSPSRSASVASQERLRTDFNRMCRTEVRHRRKKEAAMLSRIHIYAASLGFAPRRTGRRRGPI